MRLFVRIHTCLAGMAFALMFAVLGVPSAFASHGGPHDYLGIPINYLSHGAAPYLDQAYPDIMTLAAKLESDPAYAGTPAMADIRTLADYARYERAISLGGVTYGSLTSDLNPFHYPTHASLATAREILIRMNALAGSNNQAVRTLFDTINDTMVQNGANLITCTYSMDTFNTATTAWPDAFSLGNHLTPFHKAQLGLALLLLVAGALSIRWQWKHANRAQLA